MKNPYLHFPLILFLVCSLAGGALFITYSQTKTAIEEQQARTRILALGKIFSQGYGSTEDVFAQDGSLLYTRIWKDQSKNGPADFYAVTGAGIGYNTGVPIELLAGFTNPEKPGPESDNRNEAVLVGWSVTKSEETPGLGEKIKDSSAAYTLSQWVTGSIPADDGDRRTDFQKQFFHPETKRFYTPKDLILWKNGGSIDIISGATYTSVGVIKAIQNAESRLLLALKNQ